VTALVSVDGRIVPAEEARISVLDLGLQLGLAVFETLLVEGQRIFYFAEHVERMRSGARALGIEWPERFDAERAMLAFAARSGPERRAVRAMLTRGVPGVGASLVVTARAVEPPPAEGVELVVARERVLSGDPVVAIKSTNRARNVLAREEARARGAWDALFATEEGDFTESTIANLFCVHAGELTTPALDRGCLPGVTRARVIELARALEAIDEGSSVVEGRVEPRDVERADEVFLTNTTGGVVPVRAVRGLRAELPGPAGEWTRALAERLRTDQDARSRSLEGLGG